jgi:aminoglycoside N3'-acetyltransferase
MKINIPSHLSDDALVVAVKSLAGCEREATASLIAHLAELDARQLYLGAGFSSLFTYCCTVLHLSEPAAYNRIEAARAAKGSRSFSGCSARAR